MPFFDQAFSSPHLNAAFNLMGSESIVYVDPDGVELPIDALVNRNPPVQYDEVGKAYRPSLAINVTNSATTGVDATAAIVRGYFRIPIRHGHADTRDIEITEANLKTQDGGRLTFEFL